MFKFSFVLWLSFLIILLPIWL